MLHNIIVSFRINSNLWKRFCKVSDTYGINKSDYFRGKIIEFLKEKLENGGETND